MWMTDEQLAAWDGGLIVSAQAYPGEPMRDPRTMSQVAAAAAAGGAVAVRVQGLADIQHTRQAVQVPVIGLFKDGSDGVFITPTVEHALAVAQAGAHVVALDATSRPRPDGRSLAETVRELRSRSSARLMADCSSLEDVSTAAELGFDLIGTTLAGYTGQRPKTEGPDLELVAEARALIDQAEQPMLLVCEGRVHTPEQARQARQAGAHMVVVGTAITHPTTITGWFRQALG